MRHQGWAVTLEKDLVLSFAINTLLAAPDAFRELFWAALRFFGKTDKIIQVSPLGAVRGVTALVACGCLADRTEIQRC